MKVAAEGLPVAGLIADVKEPSSDCSPSSFLNAEDLSSLGLNKDSKVSKPVVSRISVLKDSAIEIHACERSASM